MNEMEFMILAWYPPVEKNAIYRNIYSDQWIYTIILNI